MLEGATDKADPEGVHRTDTAFMVEWLMNSGVLSSVLR
jgi:hypothetical protein